MAQKMSDKQWTVILKRSITLTSSRPHREISLNLPNYWNCFSCHKILTLGKWYDHFNQNLQLRWQNNELNYFSGDMIIFCVMKWCQNNKRKDFVIIENWTKISTGFKTTVESNIINYSVLTVYLMCGFNIDVRKWN